jgi:membrane-associated phospholipid phosphatase
MLAPWFGSPRDLIALDRLYETWWFVLLGFLLWQIWQPELEKAKRFLLAFALTWIVLGIFVATAISSAGPCFAGLISGTHRYDTLLARLDAANAVSPLIALKGQAYLWQAYASDAVPVGGGISAFPSLHVGGAALCAIALYERNRLLGWAGWIYVALTWIASIMLGWHYSLDGEAAVVGVVLCWTVAGILTTPIPGELSVSLRSWTSPEPVPEPSAARVERPPSSGNRDSWTLWP